MVHEYKYVYVGAMPPLSGTIFRIVSTLNKSIFSCLLIRIIDVFRLSWPVVTEDAMYVQVYVN